MNIKDDPRSVWDVHDRSMKHLTYIVNFLSISYYLQMANAFMLKSMIDRIGLLSGDYSNIMAYVWLSIFFFYKKKTILEAKKKKELASNKLFT